MSGLCSVFRHIDDHVDESVVRLTELCRLPSINAQCSAVAETAEHIAGLPRRVGFEARIDAPDEIIRIEDLQQGAKATAALLQRFAGG